MTTKKHEILTKMVGGTLHFFCFHICGNQTNDQACGIIYSTQITESLISRNWVYIKNKV